MGKTKSNKRYLQSLTASRTVLGDWGLPINKRFALSETGRHCLPVVKLLPFTGIYFCETSQVDLMLNVYS